MVRIKLSRVHSTYPSAWHMVSIPSRSGSTANVTCLSGLSWRAGPSASYVCPSTWEAFLEEHEGDRLPFARK